MTIRRTWRRPLAGLAGLLLAAVLCLAAGATGPSVALAAPARASYDQEIQQFMCIACHEPLNVAQSPESYSERQYVRDLIAQGDTPAQIKRAMVASYGPTVLALPPAHGFSVLVYVLPPVLVILGIGGLALTIPRWRRRARQAEPLPSGASLSPEDARRLNDDLGRYA